jgi:hypothetical protein
MSDLWFFLAWFLGVARCTRLKGLLFATADHSVLVLLHRRRLKLIRNNLIAFKDPNVFSVGRSVVLPVVPGPVWLYFPCRRERPVYSYQFPTRATGNGMSDSYLGDDGWWLHAATGCSHL